MADAHARTNARAGKCRAGHADTIATLELFEQRAL